MKKYYYQGKYAHLRGPRLEREIALTHEIYEQNFELLMDAYEKKDWKKHNEYCQKEAEIEKKSIRMIKEWQRRRYDRNLRKLQKSQQVQEVAAKRGEVSGL